MAKQKKLSSSDINKNSSVQISHSINKIKENELKYTIVLVIIFMTVFAIAGYVSLKVSNDYVIDNSIYDNNLMFSTNSIVLTSKNIMSNDDGLNSMGISYTIKNNSKIKCKYHIILQLDNMAREKCGCEEGFDYHLIRYSLDDKSVKTLNENMIVYEDEIESRNLLQGKIKLWIVDEPDVDTTAHFHGKLVLEELK